VHPPTAFYFASSTNASCCNSKLQQRSLHFP
jgi:hypothetical protein